MLNGEPVFSTFHENALYKPLIKDFKKNLPLRTGELEQAVKSGDAESIKFFAHRIKGAAASYGYPKLTSLAADIEDKAKLLAEAAEPDSVMSDIEHLMNVINAHAECILRAAAD